MLLLLNMLGPAKRSTMPSLYVIKLVKFPPPDTVFVTPQSSFVDPPEEFFSAWRRKGYNRQPRDLIHLKEATDTGYNDVPPESVSVSSVTLLCYTWCYVLSLYISLCFLMHTVSLFSHCQQLYCLKVSNKSFTFHLCLKAKIKRE